MGKFYLEQSSIIMQDDLTLIIRLLISVWRITTSLSYLLIYLIKIKSRLLVGAQLSAGWFLVFDRRSRVYPPGNGTVLEVEVVYF